MTRYHDGCELCGDQQELVLSSRCHLTAPLKAVKTEKEIILSCYVPECGKEVVRLPLANAELLTEAARLIRRCQDLEGVGGVLANELQAWLDTYGGK